MKMTRTTLGQARRGQVGRTIAWTLVALALATRPVWAVTFTTNTTINAGDTTYDNQDIVVSGCTVTINGPHPFNSLQIINSGVVTHSAAPAGEVDHKLDLTIAQDVTIDATSRIDVNGTGYSPSTGPGRGQDCPTAGGGGAGHGGLGGPGDCTSGGGVSYGSVLEPVDFGSGGGAGPASMGGAGGGAVKLVVNGTMQLDGNVTANGTDNLFFGNGYGGGGSGGSIFITAGTLTGAGTITARGATGWNRNCGAGGRIAIYSGADSFSGTRSACGGRYSDQIAGGAGTNYSKLSGEGSGTLLVDNAGRAGANTPIGPLGVIHRLNVAGGAAIDPQAPLTVAQLQLGTASTIKHATSGKIEVTVQGNASIEGGSSILANVILTVTGDAFIDGVSSISSDGKGYGPSTGPGAGGSGTAYGGGAGHGGKGGKAHDEWGWSPGAGGVSYGSSVDPVDGGSGGGNTTRGMSGGAGGGTIRLVVTGTLTMDGILTANGNPGQLPDGAGGGGAGGSIYVSAGTLAGAGIISANGGDGLAYAGGGAGGRIAIYATIKQGDVFQSVTAAGGWAYYMDGLGEPGTIYPSGSWPENNTSADGDDVYTHSGEYSTSVTDVQIPARGLPIVIARTYRSSGGPKVLGYGWDLNVNTKISAPATGTTVWLRTGDNRSVGYTSTGSGNYKTPTGRYDTLVKNGNGTYTLTDKHKGRQEFNAAGDLTSVVDRNGNALTFTYAYSGAGPSTMTDATGRQITFTYNAQNLLTSISDWTGRTWTYGYDAARNLTSVTDPATPEFPTGTTTTYTYENHRLKTITDAKGQVYLTNTYNSIGQVISQDTGGSITTFSYDPATKVTTIMDARGVVKKTTHNNAGNPIREETFTSGVRPGDPASFAAVSEYNANMEGTKVTHPRGNREELTYDAKGNVLTNTKVASPVSGDSNIVTSFTYHATYNFPATITDPRGNVTTNTYDAANGNLTQTKLPSVTGGQPTTTFTYNAYGQVDTKTDPDGKVTRHEYDPATGYLLRITYNYGGTPTQVSEYTYDSVGNRTSTKDPNGHITTFTYNAQDQLTQEVSPLGYITKYSYDANGNRIKVERQNPEAADGWQTTTYTYTLRNKVATATDDMGHVTTNTYDANDNVIAVEDAEHHTTTYTYDERNLLYKTTDALGNVTERGYDANGNLTSLKDANGNVTTFAYDGFNRLKTTTYPDTRTEAVTYDAASNLTQFTNRRGQNITYTYDAINRRLTKARPDYSTITYAYDLVGRLLTLTDTTGTVTNLYDSLGRVRQVTDTNGKVAAYEYDLGGNRTKLTYPDGFYVTYDYDAMDRLIAIRDPAQAVTADLNGDGYVNNADLALFVGCTSGPDVPRSSDPTCVKADFDGDGDVDMDDFGSLQQSILGSSPYPALVAQYGYDVLSRRTSAAFGNRTTAAYTYDDANRMLGLVNQFKIGSLGFAYTHDAVGNRLTKTVNGTAVTTYAYDAIYQLTGADYPAMQDTTFGYDPAGNRTSVVGGATVSYAVNNLNEYTTVGAAAYTYDNSGNLTGNGVSTYTYDSENRLKTATKTGTTATYTYDARGQRLAKTVNGVVTRYVYDGSRILAECNAAGQTLRRYVYGPGIDEPIRMDVATTPGGSTVTPYYYHFDSLGSVMALTDSAGQVIEQYDYDVYGQPTNTSTVGNPYLFTGREYDAETGLYHYRARAYDPSIGRFLQTDPMGYHDDDNLYTYTMNNPVNRTDPTGLFSLSGVWKSFTSSFSRAVSSFSSSFSRSVSSASSRASSFARNFSSQAKQVVSKAAPKISGSVTAARRAAVSAGSAILSSLPDVLEKAGAYSRFAQSRNPATGFLIPGHHLEYPLGSISKAAGRLAPWVAVSQTTSEVSGIWKTPGQVPAKILKTVGGVSTDVLSYAAGAAAMAYTAPTGPGIAGGAAAAIFVGAVGEKTKEAIYQGIDAAFPQ